MDATYHEEQARAKMEEEEKLKEFNARVSLENEVSKLKSEVVALQQSCGSNAQDGNEDIKSYQACISDREKEVSRLKELLKIERIRADSETMNAEKERKKAAKAWKLLEAEKNKNVEKAKQIAKMEAEKAGELNRNAEKLASKMKEFAEDNLMKAMEEKQLANQMSQKLEECERTKKDLKQEISEVSSLT